VRRKVDLLGQLMDINELYRHFFLLYRPLQPANTKPATATAVPYCTWGNRGLGKMAVWLNATP
jgi:DUF1680 family protein